MVGGCWKGGVARFVKVLQKFTFDLCAVWAGCSAEPVYSLFLSVSFVYTYISKLREGSCGFCLPLGRHTGIYGTSYDLVRASRAHEFNG